MFGSFRDQHFQKVSPLMTLVMYTCSSDPTLERLSYQSRLAFFYEVCAQLLDDFKDRDSEQIQVT